MAAVRYTRSKEWIIATGNKSIPYQPRGRGEKNYGVVDSEKNLPLLEEGNKLHRRYMTTEARNQLVQYELARDLCENSIVDRQLMNILIAMQEVIINTFLQIEQNELEREEQAA